MTNVVAVSGGDFHNLALKADGTVVAWGDGTYGQTAVPPGLTNVVVIQAGGYHNLALKADRSLLAWGYDGNGQVSSLPPGQDIAGMAGGGFFSLAFHADGSPFGWGDDSQGQVDVPTGQPTATVAIAAGFDFALSLQSSAPVQVALLLQPIGNQLQLTCLGGTLQSAVDPNGPYGDVTGTSPHLLDPGEARQFYRVRVQP